MEKTDAEKLMGAFALALSASMPKDLSDRIATNLDRLALEMRNRDGRTRIDMLCTDLAESMRSVHPARH